MIIWIVTHVALAIAFAFVCHGVGRLVIREHFAAATALGYGILAEVLYGLALFGVLTRTNVLIVFAIAAVVAIPSLRRIAITRFHLLVVAASIPSLLIAMYPVIGYDATMYHFVYARLFAESGRLVFADALRFPVFPQLAETHFTAAILLFGDHAAQLTGWVALPITALATAKLVRSAGGSDRAALFASALWLGTPPAVYGAASGYIDVTLTMFVTLAISGATGALVRGAGGGEGREGPADHSRPRVSPLLTGLFAGLAAATKYHGLFFIPALLRRRGLVWFLAGAALFAAPTYLHITRTTGSPLFPFGGAIFGAHDYQPGVERSLRGADAASVTHRIPNASPFVMMYQRAIRGPLRMGVPPHSPFVLLLLPFAIAGAVLAPVLRRPLVFAGIYAILVSGLDWRFMLLILPLVVAAISIAIEHLVSKRFTLAVALLFLGPGFGWGTLLMVMKYGPMPVTQAEREAFVARKIGVYRAVHALGPATVYVYQAPNMAYYCPGKCLGEKNGPHRFERVWSSLSNGPALAEKLRDWGATGLVIDKKTSKTFPGPPFVRVYEDDRAAAYRLP